LVDCYSAQLRLVCKVVYSPECVEKLSGKFQTRANRLAISRIIAA
jgi:hypothetical protein